MKQHTHFIFTYFCLFIIALSMHRQCRSFFERKYKPLQEQSDTHNKKIYAQLTSFDALAYFYLSSTDLSASKAAYEQLLNTTQIKTKSQKEKRANMLSLLALESVVYACKRIDELLKDQSLNENAVAQKYAQIRKKLAVTKTDLVTVKKAVPYTLQSFVQEVVKNQLFAPEAAEQLLTDELSTLNTMYQQIKDASTALNGSWKLPNEITTTAINNFFKQK